jgi:uncharacterized protein (TIGR01732 family)
MYKLFHFTYFNSVLRKEVGFMGCFGGYGGGYGYAAPVAGYGGGMGSSFALIVVLFILLIIIGAVCWN